jgi:hypothetical protein
MGGAPVIETIRAGVGFVHSAASSFRRAEAGWEEKTGRARIGCNSSFRDYGLQLSMYQAWTAWTERRGPKPNHSRPAKPEDSKHVMGLALDTPDIGIPGFLAHMAEHGWIQILPNDPTERHHLEYQWWRDQHYGEPVPAPAATKPLPDKEESHDMYAIRQIGQPDSGVIIRPGVPPYALPAQVFETEASTYGLTIKDLPDWRYGTAVREQWTAFNTAERFRADVNLTAESVQEVADATRKTIIAPEHG